jgi:hypothetical protein
MLQTIVLVTAAHGFWSPPYIADMPACGFTGNLCNYQPYYYGGAGGLVSVACIVGAIVYYQYRLVSCVCLYLCPTTLAG